MAIVDTGIPQPLVINDAGLGVKVVFAEAIGTSLEISNSTGSSDIETVTFKFKGNLKLLSL